MLVGHVKEERRLMALSGLAARGSGLLSLSSSNCSLVMVLDQDANDVGGENRGPIIRLQSFTTSKKLLKGILGHGVLALVGMHNASNSAESAHTSVTGDSLEELDHDTVGLCHHKLNNLSSLLGSDMRDVLGLSG